MQNGLDQARSAISGERHTCMYYLKRKGKLSVLKLENTIVIWITNFKINKYGHQHVVLKPNRMKENLWICRLNAVFSWTYDSQWKEEASVSVTASTWLLNVKTYTKHFLCVHVWIKYDVIYICYYIFLLWNVVAPRTHDKPKLLDDDVRILKNCSKVRHFFYEFLIHETKSDFPSFFLLSSKKNLLTHDTHNMF